VRFNTPIQEEEEDKERLRRKIQRDYRKLASASKLSLHPSKI